MHRSRSNGNFTKQPKVKTSFNVSLDRPYSRTPSEVSRTFEQNRVCFVCGGSFEPGRITCHEIECHSHWQSEKSKIANRFHVTSPKRILIPTVDGTINVHRINRDADDSAKQANTATCKKCKKNVDFYSALSHKCERYEPRIHCYS
ncbi:hypothetical protein L596_010938 [Steinernema carpocapsae]|uniref:Uncharacterized protein n=1 Tax=Steinernema carpocapsae TaxID=34508 RepID=A0A4U5PJT9_STECR|nr:hypothetical protein L596_010938 [Steinernema carpocapsae]